MLEIASQFAPRLTHVEKFEMSKALKAVIAEELNGSEGDFGSRSGCGCPKFVGKGRDADGSRRRLCRGCGRTFSAKTRGLPAGSRLPASARAGFASCEADELSLQECTDRCEARPPAARFTKMCPSGVVRSRLAGFRLASRVRAGSACLSESLSGDSRRLRGFPVPRRRHRNGSDADARGIELEGLRHDRRE